ncbi:MAG: GNAT family N-acetyltransferase [Anaerolineales bacterium]
MDVKPVILNGHVVRLEPLSEAHVPNLTEAALDESIWLYMRYGKIMTQRDMAEWVSGLLRLQAAGTDLPFAVILQETGRAIGSTRYLDIQLHNRALEIGGTWYGVDYQRTAVNTECKYMLLRHAFEALGCVRVQFKTDVRNLRSQKALERIGAVREGVLREHMILPDGYLRSSVYYSILKSEWQKVKPMLEDKLGWGYP